MAQREVGASCQIRMGIMLHEATTVLDAGRQGSSDARVMVVGHENQPHSVRSSHSSDSRAQ